MTPGVKSGPMPAFMSFTSSPSSKPLYMDMARALMMGPMKPLSCIYSGMSVSWAMMGTAPELASFMLTKASVPCTWSV